MARVILERHLFAPEMNKLHLRHLGGAVVNVPGAATIGDARRKAFPRSARGVQAIVSKEYPAPFQSLNRTWSGMVAHRRDAIQFARAERERNKGGPLLDGSTLPAPVIRVRTRLVG